MAKVLQIYNNGNYVNLISSDRDTLEKLAEKYNMRAIARISAEFFQIMFYKNSDMKEFISAIK